VRLYSDEEGESHFEDFEISLEPTDFTPPAAPLHLASLGAATAIALVAGQSDWRGQEPHPAPARRFMASLVVATGRGVVLFAAAELAGEPGQVIGVDLAEEMVAR
jgi:hypothetical protein